MKIEHINNHVLQLRGNCDASLATESSTLEVRDHLKGIQEKHERSPVLEALITILSPMGQRGF